MQSVAPPEVFVSSAGGGGACRKRRAHSLKTLYAGYARELRKVIMLPVAEMRRLLLPVICEIIVDSTLSYLRLSTKTPLE